MQNKRPQFSSFMVSGDGESASQQNEFTVFSGSDGSQNEMQPNLTANVSEYQAQAFADNQQYLASSQDAVMLTSVRQEPRSQNKTVSISRDEQVLSQPNQTDCQETSHDQHVPEQMFQTDVHTESSVAYRAAESNGEPVHQSHAGEQTIQTDSTQSWQGLDQPRSENLQVSELKIRPSVSLLVFRLLGLGLVLLLIMFFLAIMVDLFRLVFGDQVFVLLNNRMFTFTAGIILYMILGLIVYQQWSHTVYTLTAEKLMIERGWIIKFRQTRDMVQFGGVQVNQGVIGKMFNFGDLRLEYHGAIGKVAGENLHDIPDPFLHEQMLVRMIRTSAE